MYGILRLAWPGRSTCFTRAEREFESDACRGPLDTMENAAFEQRRAVCAPTKKKVETYFDLIDLEEDRLS